MSWWNPFSSDDENTTNETPGGEEEYPDWPMRYGRPNRRTGCPNCGGRDIEINTVHGRHPAMSIGSVYHPGEGVFKFELDCNVCEWSETRQMQTEVVED